MKKLILLLLLAVSVNASDFAMRFSDCRGRIRNKLGVDQNNLYEIRDTVLNGFIREAIATVNQYAEGTITLDTVTLTYRTSLYQLDSLVTKVRAVWWEKLDSTKSLLYLPSHLWHEQEARVTKGNDGFLARPSYYDWFRPNNSNPYLLVYPTPTISGDTLLILTSCRQRDISATDSMYYVTQEARIPIVNYATYLAALYLSRPDVELHYRNYLHSLGLEVKSEKDSL